MHLRSNFSQKSILKIPEMAFQRFGISKFPGGECPRTPLDLCRHKCALVRYRAGSAPDIPHTKRARFNYAIFAALIHDA